MKYRNLTFQELSVMEDDFSEYLYSKGFNRYEWNFFQDYAPIQAIKMIGQYSDIAFEKVMQNIQFLSHREKNEVISYNFKSFEFEKITISILNNSFFDFRKELPKNYELSNFHLGCSYTKVVEPCAKSREKTIFELIERGFMASDNKLHVTLKSLRKASLN